MAAAIRIARFSPEVILLEKHSRLGGLNSYFYRNKILYETGLHAITNYAEPGDKKAPLNRLLRQLKLRRKDISLCQQLQSKIVFKDVESLLFSNDFNLFESEVTTKFPKSADNFKKLLTFLLDYDPFTPSPFRSAKNLLHEFLGDRLLVDMILCPLMYYGSSHENDMDLNQFAILFRAVFWEGMCRPEGTIKDFIDLLVGQLENFGGKIRKNCAVDKIIPGTDSSVVQLESGERIECDFILSTIGHTETLNLVDKQRDSRAEQVVRLGFTETIFQLEDPSTLDLPRDTTILFYNDRNTFSFKQPDDYADYSSGVICFPRNFQGLAPRSGMEIRSTHLANYSKWKEISADKNTYRLQKEITSSHSLQKIEKLVGNFKSSVTFKDTFTPITIERYSSKIHGAIYGSPIKVKDGFLGYDNIFLAGTDQGFLGIIGSMLSGITIANRHILPKL